MIMRTGGMAIPYGPVLDMGEQRPACVSSWQPSKGCRWTFHNPLPTTLVASKPLSSRRAQKQNTRAEPLPI